MKYKLEQIWCIFKYSLSTILNDLILGLILAPWVYPIFIYPTRNIIRFFWYKCGIVGKIISWPGFIFLNDPEADGKCDDYGDEIYRKSIGFTQPLEKLTWYQKYWISCRWSAWRNPVWNIHRFVKPKYDDDDHPYDVYPVCNDGYTRFTIQEFFNSKSASYIKGLMPSNFADDMDYCVLKYKFEDGTEADNFGTILDLNKSILGKIFIFYRIKGILYFRYSKAWIDLKERTGYKIQLKWKFWNSKIIKYKYNLAHELQLGTNGRRFKVRIKYKKVKPII